MKKYNLGYINLEKNNSGYINLVRKCKVLFVLYGYSVPLGLFCLKVFLLTFPQPWEQDMYLPIFYYDLRAKTSTLVFIRAKVGLN